MSTPQKAIIIGAGVAGLGTAIRLAVQGFEVVVFEKNSYPGGKLSHFTLGDFQFDAGPSLFVQPENIVELFELANEPIEEFFSYEKVPVTCKYFYENGTVINAFGDVKLLAEEIKLKTNEDAEKINAYLQQSANLYDDIGSLFIDNSIHSLPHFMKAPLAKAIKATRFKYIFSSLHQLNTRHFKTAETTQLFDRFATYNGSNPYSAPGMLSMIPHLECNQGVYYPKGGMKSITEALYRLALKKGVRFHFGSAIQKIVHSKGRVNGVEVNGDEILADVVVSNADVYFTYKHLLNNAAKAEKLARQERSCSAIIFYWGMNKQFPALDLHNIFFSNDYKKEFAQLFQKKTISDDPTVYVNVTSKMESGQAPQGKENWFVMVNAPANYQQDWPNLKSRCRQNVIAKLNRMLQADVENCIEVEETLDPIKIEQATSCYMGALYGSSSNSKMAAFLRHPNFSSAIKGLYFAGGTVHPGGGIPLCLKSAKLVSRLIEEDNKKLFLRS